MEKLEKLLAKMRNGLCYFVYRKVNGQERKACGTLYGVAHTIKGTSKLKDNNTILRYFDVDCNAWRSFRIENLVEVGSSRKQTVEEHHNICVSLVVELKKKMKYEGVTAFAYRKNNGEIRFAHGILLPEEKGNDRLFSYFDTDKGEKRTFCIDRFIGIGEKADFQDLYADKSIFSENKEEPLNANNHSYNNIESFNISNILKKHGIEDKEVENIYIIDLLGEMNKEQLKDLICKAAERMARL